MEAENRTEIGSLGEFGLIQHLTSGHHPQNPTTLVGVGDDAAVLDMGGMRTVLTTDLLLEGIHFDLAYTPLKHLGYKAIAVNLSDVYAMNATPTQVTVSMGLSNRFSVEAVTELYEGIYAACRRYGVDLVGGDTSASQKGLIISVTALGLVGEEQEALRSGARPEDLIVVSGNLGAAFLGLKILEREKKIFLESPEVKPSFEGHEYCVGRLLKPEPRADVVAWLADEGIVPTAMIDISDGLSSELLHLCTSSGVGCRIYERDIPIHPDAAEAAEQFQLPVLSCALSGGEDYELLLTVPDVYREVVENNSNLRIIGKITAEQPALLESTAGKEHELQAQGWNALRNAE